jgi:deoxyribose-phosphate aldolase
VNPLNEAEIIREASRLVASKRPLLSGDLTRTAWLLKAVSCIDLTTLAGDDTEVNVLRLVHKALNPLQKGACRGEDYPPVTCAAVCVYPARVPDACRVLKAAGSDLPVASGKSTVDI